MKQIKVNRKIRLGVNVDHVATIRQSRFTQYPSPVLAALAAEKAGAEQITVHLREDRRHIQEQDVIDLKQKINIPLNLEMAHTSAMIEFALKIKPHICCLVPEKRAELTTEGGLNLISQFDELKISIAKLTAVGIRSSLFIEPNLKQVECAKELAVDAIEFHTGHYADAKSENLCQKKLTELQQACCFAKDIGLAVHAGHGLHYDNVQAIVAIEQIEELNIGHSIIARAIFVGMEQAVGEMQKLLQLC